jgi:hypothetical protein
LRRTGLYVHNCHGAGWERREFQQQRKKFWSKRMGGRIGLASVLVVVLGVGVARAEPLRIRAAWVAPIYEWFSNWLDKKDLGDH